jgi:hypothetical protein
MPNAQLKALEAMGNSLLIFKRTFSFASPSSDLIRTVASIIQSDSPSLLTPSYNILRRCIDYFYPYMESHMPTVRSITLADLQSGVEPRQTEACFLWSTIGEVESDIRREDKRQVKRKHEDFDHCFNYSSSQFPPLFEVLTALISSTDPTQTDAHFGLEYTAAHAAFSCVSSLTLATGDTALGPIFGFVRENEHSEDWRLRYASALLLNAGSQLPGFRGAVKNILFAFQFFVRAVGDPIARISEVAMWSVGRMVDEIPDLLADGERFGNLCNAIAIKMSASEELTCRGCWLLDTCFCAFSPDDEDSLLVQQFDVFADLLLQASDAFGVDAEEAAMGALSRLIEKTPGTIVEEYNRLFEKVTEKLGTLV